MLVYLLTESLVAVVAGPNKDCSKCRVCRGADLQDAPGTYKSHRQLSGKHLYLRIVVCVEQKAAMSVFQNFREIAFENFENSHAIFTPHMNARKIISGPINHKSSIFWQCEVKTALNVIIICIKDIAAFKFVGYTVIKYTVNISCFSYELRRHRQNQLSFQHKGKSSYFVDCTLKIANSCFLFC